MSARLVDDYSCNHESKFSTRGVSSRRGWQDKTRSVRFTRGDVRRLAGTCVWPNRPHAYDRQGAFQKRIRFILKECVKKHPSISIEKTIFGGIPHVHELRLSVGDVLSQVYMRGSIKAVVDYYAPHVTEEEIKDAIAFAQDVLEITCDPHQTDG